MAQSVSYLLFKEVVDITTTKMYTVKEARVLRGMSRRQLATATNLSIGTIGAIENDSGKYKNHIGVAVAIADALALEVSEIVWPRGLSVKGRPPHTGKPISRKHLSLVADIVLEPEVECCNDCNLELPVVRVCGFCAA